MVPPANRCPSHRRKAEAGDPERRKVYNSRRWQGLRRTVLREQEWCEKCGTNFANEVHHLVALADGGSPYDRTKALCKRCHSRLTAQETWGH